MNEINTYYRPRVELRKEEENYTIMSFIPHAKLHIFWRQSS